MMDAKYKKVAAATTVSLVLLAGLVFVLYEEEEPPLSLYNPEVELPGDYMVLVEYPKSQDDMMAIGCLSSLLASGEKYHPLVILNPDGELSRQELYTMTNQKEDRAKLLFIKTEGLFSKVNAQLQEAGLSPVEENLSFPLQTDVSSMFFGFDGIMTVSSFPEALWATTIARHNNLALIQGPSTYRTQEESWKDLHSLGIVADYIIATNPYDVTLKILNQSTPDYDSYDDTWFCSALSALTGALATYHNAYVITEAGPVDNVDWTLNLEFSQNRRALGYYAMIRNVSARYGPAEYVCIVGSASSVPQFLTQISNQGDIINSDIIYGFLSDDIMNQDAAVGRFIQYDVSLASNQLFKSFFFDDFVDEVHVDYRDIAGGPHKKEWKKHGASFSGYDITYKRMQATPARWICKDFEDAGFTYDYVGPSGTGIKVADGVVDSKENDLVEICSGSGYVAYRGHGSDTGSLYGIRVSGPNGEEHTLNYEDCQSMDVTPQVAFFVSCLNAKIYGHGPGTAPGSDVDFGSLFTLNYLASGPAVLIGATEVSYSNIGQDIPALRGEYGILTDDHKWDHNDAWYAFVWDGLLNHPDEHGTVGKAVQWCENRYMAYGPNNSPTPFEPEDTVDWREVTFFTMYGDPSFRPGIPLGTQPSYDPWHNGPEDG